MVGARSRLVTFAVASICGVVAVVGCSADGTSGSDVDTAATEPTTPAPGSQLPPASSAPASDDDDDASKPPAKDAGKDSSVDAGPPPPVPGTACAVIDEVRKKKCGVCGQQGAICLAGGKWSEYSACESELAGGCLPGTTTTEPCGNCGTRTKTCSQYCAYTSTACTGQPAGACVPGAVELSSAGCTTADTYRQRSCQGTCTYASFGATCDPAPTTVNVGPTVGSITSTIVTLKSTAIAPRLGGSCPTAALAAATSTPFAYIKVKNALPKSVVVSIYNSIAPGGVVFPTILASYGAATPSTDAQRKACVKGVNDFGNDLLTGDVDFASLDDFDAVTIAANTTVTVYVGAYNKFNAANPSSSTGKVKLSVRVDAIN